MQLTNIAIDVDEVKSPLMEPFAQWHNKKYGTSWDPTMLKTYNVWEHWAVTKEEAIAKMFEFYATSDFEKIKPIENAVRGVSILSRGFKPMTVTARPQAIKDKTLSFLARYFEQINPDDVHFASNFYKNGDGNCKKADICTRLNASAIIEDSLEYALDCAEKGIYVFMLDKPWNQTDSLPRNVLRVQNWKELPEAVYSHFAFTKR